MMNSNGLRGASSRGVTSGDYEAEAARELLMRRRGRNTLAGFISYTDPTYTAEPFHLYLMEIAERVLRGELTRVMIYCPPQSGKSRIFSELFPAYWLAKRPDDPIILCSYSAGLAEMKGLAARMVFESEEFSRLFPQIATNRQSRSVSNWKVNGHKGYMISSGVGGPITGFGARLGIIDDPVANAEDAKSATIQEKTYAWYQQTFRTRIWTGGAIVVIQTRWNEEDLSGKLLQENDGQWAVFRLPAIAEDQETRDERNLALGLEAGLPDPIGRQTGEALSPLRYPIEALEQLRPDVGPVAWAAQYDGFPRAAEGNYFKKDWFVVTDSPPPIKGPLIRYWDKAGTAGGGKRTAGVLMGISANDGQPVVFDVVLGQWEATQREGIIRETAQADRERYGWNVHIWHEQEPASGGKESADNTQASLRGFTAYIDKVTGQKDARAEPYRIAAGKGVYLVRGWWNKDYVWEALAWPNARYKDQIDASAGAYNKLVLGKRRRTRQYGGAFNSRPDYQARRVRSGFPTHIP